MNGTVFWAVTSYSALKFTDVSEKDTASIFTAKQTQQGAGGNVGILIGLLFDSEYGDYFPPKRP
jgi:hypothetical protein